MLFHLGQASSDHLDELLAQQQRRGCLLLDSLSDLNKVVAFEHCLELVESLAGEGESLTEVVLGLGKECSVLF